MKFLILAGLVAERAECNVPNAFLIAHLFAWRVVVRIHRCDAINKTQKSDDCGKYERLSVEPQPGEVESDFVAEIFPHEAERLSLVPSFKRIGPFEIKEL